MLKILRLFTSHTPLLKSYSIRIVKEPKEFQK